MQAVLKYRRVSSVGPSRLIPPADRAPASGARWETRDRRLADPSSGRQTNGCGRRSRATVWQCATRAIATACATCWTPCIASGRGRRLPGGLPPHCGPSGRGLSPALDPRHEHLLGQHQPLGSHHAQRETGPGVHGLDRLCALPRAVPPEGAPPRPRPLSAAGSSAPRLAREAGGAEWV